MDDEELIRQLEDKIEEEEDEIVELRSWSTRDRFEDKPQPTTPTQRYSRTTTSRRYADYYYSTRYYSRQSESPLGMTYNTDGIR